MKPDISEFSYGYAITEELIQGALSPITAAPVFPSLIQEGQPGGGYDVMLQAGGIPIFLQFKLSDYMVRRTAIEVQLNLLPRPLYRFYLRPTRHSNQHQMLLDLENAGNIVYYVAPAFHRSAELNQYYLARTVSQNSIFVPPVSIGALPDPNDHHVAFKLGGQAWRLSEPMKIETDSGGGFANRVAAGIKSFGRHDQLKRRIESLAVQMTEILERIGELRGKFLVADFEAFQKRLPAIQQVAYLSRTLFNCEFLIATFGNMNK